MACRRCFIFAIAWFSAVSATRGENTREYMAVFVDGTIVKGSSISNWHAIAAKPVLGTTSLSDKQRPLRLLRSPLPKGSSRQSDAPCFVEFVGGDRLPGRVVEFRPATQDGTPVPAHVLVETEIAVDLRSSLEPRRVRVAADRIRRVVWQGRAEGKFRPNTLYLRDGAKIPFRRVRWNSDSVFVVTDSKTRQVPFTEIAEFGLTAPDPWESYYRELAELSPTGQSRIIRFETSDGLVITGSEINFGAAAVASTSEQMAADAMATQLRIQLKNLQNQRANAQKNGETQIRQQQAVKANHARMERDHAKRQLDFIAKTEQRVKNEIAKHEQDWNKRLNDERKRANEEERRLEKRLEKESKDSRERQLRQFRQTSQNRLMQREKERDRRLAQMRKQKAGEIQRLRASEIRRQDQLKRNRARVAANAQRASDRQVARMKQFDARINQLKGQLENLPMFQGSENRPDRWRHKLKPVWSLDPVWVKFETIHARSEFAPHEVPLSRVQPVKTTQQSSLGQSWQWRTNRNVRGGELESGGRPYGWGFGVHASNQLHFALPQLARAFSCRIGLDKMVGTRGFAKAKVFLGEQASQPLYESKSLRGSAEVISTGSLPLGNANGKARTLVLSAESAHKDRPQGADPFDVFDHLNWLEPILELDPKMLQEKVGRLAP